MKISEQQLVRIVISTMAAVVESDEERAQEERDDAAATQEVVHEAAAAVRELLPLLDGVNVAHGEEVHLSREQITGLVLGVRRIGSILGEA